jgi:hypothetical protein
MSHAVADLSSVSITRDASAKKLLAALGQLYPDGGLATFWQSVYELKQYRQYVCDLNSAAILMLAHLG